MNTQIKKRLMRTMVLAMVGLTIGAGIGFYQLNNETASVTQKTSSIAPMAGVPVGGAYDLSDHNGAAVTQANFAGDYKLIYFGFTYCPAICPTELQKITKVMKALGTEGDNIQPLFITIDPERDTAPVMQEYVTLFHPRLVGLTGTRTQIDDVLAKYRVFATKVQEPEMSDYTMDHSSFIYLMSPDDQLISMYRIQDDADYMVDDIRKKLSNS